MGLDPHKAFGLDKCNQTNAHTSLQLGYQPYLNRDASGSDGKESAYSAGAPGSIPGSRSPGEGNGNPLQYSRVENPPGQRSLAGYSPWGRKELD